MVGAETTNQEEATDGECRTGIVVSFLDTLRWLLTAEPGEPPPNLIINPRRPGRHEPRVIKDLQDTYRKMVLPRHEMKKQLHKWRGRPK